MKLFLQSMLLSLCCLQAQGQTKTLPDFFVKGSDTTFGTITGLYRGGGQVYKIIYTDTDGETQEIKKDEVKQVTTMRVAGYVMDYIPMKPSKPESYHMHIERKVDGKVIIYEKVGLVVTTDKEGNRELYSAVTPGTQIHTIKIDGTFYKIDKKNIEDVIAPYLKKCDAFSKGFTDTITETNINEAVTLYNKLCP